MRIVEKIKFYASMAPGARRNRTDLLRHLVRRPTIAAGIGAYEFGLFLSGGLENRTKALAALRTSSLIGCEFCLDLGSAAVRAFGISETDLEALPTFRSSEAFSERERLAIEYADAMTLTPTKVNDELRSRLNQEFSPAQLTELAAEIAWENHRARLNRALGVRSMGFSDGQFCLRPRSGLRPSETV